MPRPRARPLFELAGQWIAKDPGSPLLYRFWTEPGTGRTRRASLRTADLEDAKKAFAAAVLLQQPGRVDGPLSVILEAYFRARTDTLPSKKHARLAGRTILACWGQTISVGQLTETKQKEFAEWSVKKGHSLSYISRNLSVLGAAIAHADIPLKVRFGKREIASRWNLRTKAPRRGYVPTDGEMRAFLLREIPRDLYRWCIMAALTGGRPEAVMDLTPGSRRREAQLIDLCPAGRPQNKKFRPIVKEPRALGKWLDKWEREMRIEVGKRTLTLPTQADISGERYCTYASVDSLQTAMQRARAEDKANLPKLSVYSFRHKVVTVLRQARVPEDEIAIQIGHKRPGLEVTAGYGEWSPDYLARASKALDAWWTRLNSQRTPKRKLAK